MNQSVLVKAMNLELAAASEDLVGNSDLLRAVLAGCGDCIKVLDLEGRVQFMSEGGKRVMEVDDFSILKGCPWPDFWPGDGNAQAMHAIAEGRAGRTSNFRNAANTAKGTPRYWDVHVSPIYGDDGKPAQLLSISRDITEEWKAQEAQREHLARQMFLTQELTHRVKNTLMTVIALANQSFRGDEHAAQRKTFIARIQALDAAYSVLTQSNWSDSSTRQVVDTALMPYRVYAERISVSGPDFHLAPNRALALALALNELATNALKYGALSETGGKVEVSWHVTQAEGASGFRFQWHESGGPAVTPPQRTGFGSRLIKDVLAQDFRGSVDISYDAAGLVCVLKAPAK